jgi:ABC-2 type transport system permease protein
MRTAVATTPAVSALGRLTLTELKLSVRERLGIIWGVAFPPILLIIFGNIHGFRTPVSKSTGSFSILAAYVPILIAFVLAMLALNALPMVLAGYREKGILRRLATTPVGPGRVLAAQLLVNLLIGAAALILIVAVARISFGVALPRQAAGFVLAAGLATAALFAMGLVIAAVAPTGRIANGIGAIVFFPMMFFAGLWLPISAMPPTLRHISHLTPLGAAAQALQDTAQGHWPAAASLAVMAGYALVFSLAVARLFRWE